MTRNRMLLIEARAIAIAVLLAALCGGTALTLYAGIDQQRAHSSRLIAANKRAADLSNVLSVLQDAETGQRGYLLTGREEYLEPYNDAVVKIEAALLRLKFDDFSEGDAQGQLTRIEGSARAKLEELEQTVVLRQRQGFEAAQALVLTGAGKRIMDRLRTMIGGMLDAENGSIILEAERTEAKARQNLVKWFCGACALISLIAFCTGLIIRKARREENLNRDLAYQSSHDALTGLVNRRALFQRLEHALGQAEDKRKVALFYADLNDFKAINDRHGHGAGDLVLIETAHRLRSAVRPDDMVARLGGDEFVVLVTCEADQQGVIYERLKRSLAHMQLACLQGSTAGASLGMAQAHDGVTPQMLVAAADMAMYRAKAASKNPANSEPALARLRLVPSAV